MNDNRNLMAHRRKDDGYGILGVLLLIALVCVLVWTNPPAGKHRARVWAVATEEAANDSWLVFRLIGLPLIEGADTALKLQVLNLGICSVGYSDGNPSALSFGALGGVIAFAWWK